MISINEIYLFKTKDKTPYLLTVDALAFTRNDPTANEFPEIQELKLNPANEVFYHFKECLVANMDYTVSAGSNAGLPYQGQGRSIYSYKIQIKLNSEVKFYDQEFLRQLSQLSYPKVQIAYAAKTNGLSVMQNLFYQLQQLTIIRL